jgi:hypothetical protein
LFQDKDRRTVISTPSPVRNVLCNSGRRWVEFSCSTSARLPAARQRIGSGLAAPSSTLPKLEIPQIVLEVEDLAIGT